MNESKECHLNNNDTLSNCLKIINAGANTKRNTHMSSSHGKYAAEVRTHMNDKEDAILAADVDSATYFDQYDLQGNH